MQPAMRGGLVYLLPSCPITPAPTAARSCACCSWLQCGPEGVHHHGRLYSTGDTVASENPKSALVILSVTHGRTRPIGATRHVERSAPVLLGLAGHFARPERSSSVPFEVGRCARTNPLVPTIIPRREQTASAWPFTSCCCCYSAVV